MGQELAGPLGEELALGGGDPAASIDDHRLAAHLSRFGRDRTDEVDLGLRLVYRSPTARVVWTAHPSAESRIVFAKPPCTTPIGL